MGHCSLQTLLVEAMVYIRDKPPTFEVAYGIRQIHQLARWALLLQEYDFEVVHQADITNLDADGLSRNPSLFDEDLIGAKWHGDYDKELVPGWHATTYRSLFSGFASEILDQSLNEETDKC